MIPAALSQNPWQEAPQDRSAAQLAAILHSMSRLREIRSRLPDLRTSLDDFTSDLEAIAEAHRANFMSYRLCRAFVAVHLPALVEALEQLDELGRRKADPERLAVIEAELRACLAASAQTRKRLDDLELTDLEVEASVLSQKLTAPAKAITDASEPAAKSKWNMSSRFAGAGNAIQGRIARGAEDVSSFGNELISRAGAGTSAAGTYLSGLLEDGLDAIAIPLASHRRAIADALTTGTISALTGGVLAAIIFPPAIPVALGIAVLDGGGKYFESIGAHAEAEQKAREPRRRDRDEKLSAALRALRGKSRILRMETPHLHMTVDTETRTTEGIILTGAHAGQSLADIPAARRDLLARTAPDAETRALIERFRPQEPPR